MTVSNNLKTWLVVAKIVNIKYIHTYCDMHDQG